MIDRRLAGLSPAERKDELPEDEKIVKPSQARAEVHARF